MFKHHPYEIESRVKAWLECVDWQAWDEKTQSYIPVNPFARPGSLTESIRKAEEERKQYFFARVIKIGMPWAEEKEVEETGKIVERKDAKLFWEAKRFWRLCTESHSVLFARDGEGKSACRLMVANGVRRERDILVVQYLDFNQHPRSVQEHARIIGDLMLQALKDQRGVMPDVARFRLLKPLPRLININHTVRGLGYKAVFVLVDDVKEGFGPKPTEDEIELVVENLFAPILLKIPGLYFKYFLPECLIDRISHYRVIAHRGYPFRLFHVRWEEADLEHLLEEKISSVSQRGEKRFQPLSDDGTGQPFDIDKELIEIALGQPGAPRNLNVLACELIHAHARNEPNPEKFRLTKGDLEDAILRFESQTKPPKLLEEAPLPTEERLNPFFLLALLLVAIVSTSGLVIIVYWATKSALLTIITFIFATLFFVLVVAFALTKGWFQPEQTLEIIRQVLDIIGGAFSALIGSFADILQRMSEPKDSQKE